MNIIRNANATVALQEEEKTGDDGRQQILIIRIFDRSIKNEMVETYG